METFKEFFGKKAVIDKDQEELFDAMKGGTLQSSSWMGAGKLGFDTFFMNTFKNIGVSKGGAEGMQALALYTSKYGNISLALKVADGNHRGNYMACIKILRHLDAIDANEELQLLNFVKEKQVNLNGIVTGDLQCYISN